jgi:hypothetical protein
VRAAWLDGIVELDVRELGSADDLLLFFDGHAVPRVQRMQILLHDHVAAAGEGRVFATDDDGIDRRLIRGILGPVDKTDQVTVVEINEAMDLVDRVDGIADPGHDLGRQFETQVHAFGRTNVEQNVARRRDGMVPTLDFPEGMQVDRPRLPEKAVPGVRAESHDA